MPTPYTWGAKEDGRSGTEMSLQVLACSIKQVIAILDAGPLMEAIRA